LRSLRRARKAPAQGIGARNEVGALDAVAALDAFVDVAKNLEPRLAPARLDEGCRPAREGATDAGRNVIPLEWRDATAVAGRYDAAGTPTTLLMIISVDVSSSRPELAAEGKRGVNRSVEPSITTA
jgi:hypothetical protein